MQYNTATIPQKKSLAFPWGPICAIIGAILIGLSPAVVRILHQEPISTGFYRILLALPLIWGWSCWEKKSLPKKITPTRKDYQLLFLAGVFFALDLTFMYTAIEYTTLANVSLFNNLCAFFTPIILWLLTSERPRPIFLLASTVAVIGLAFMIGDNLTLTATSLYGDLFGVISGIFVSGYIIVVKQLRSRLHSSTVMFWAGVSSTICLCTLAFVRGENMIPCSYHECLLLLGIATLCHASGQGLFAVSMGSISSTLGALTMMVAPIVTVCMGWLLFAEILDAPKILGMILILSSILVMQIKRKSPLQKSLK